MTDTFQPGDLVTWKLHKNDAEALNQQHLLPIGTVIYPALIVDKIVAHTRPGEATPQKQEMREVVERCAHQFRYYEKLHRAKPDHAKADTNAEFAMMCEQAIARADLPGEGMKSAEEWAAKFLVDYSKKENHTHTVKLIQAIQQDARRGGPEPRPTPDEVCDCQMGETCDVCCPEPDPKPADIK